MTILKAISFFVETAKRSKVDTDVLQQVGEAAPLHRRYHLRIVWISIVTGVIVGAIGTIGMLQQPSPKGESGELWIAPILFVVMGILLGTAAACLFAPSEFLLGPMGTKWMELIGAKTTASSRFVCAVVTFFLGAGAVFMVFLLR